MTDYGRLNITIDSSLSEYSTQIDSIYAALQGVAAADDLFSTSSGPSVTFSIVATTGET
jgi:hypothetical protein